MSLQLQYRPYTLQFRFEAGTSRGVLTEKTTFFVKISNSDEPNRIGLGECGPLAGLSLDDSPQFEAQLAQFCKEFNEYDIEIFEWNIPVILDQMISSRWPAIRFGIETAMRDYLNGGKRIVFENDFTTQHKPILINGLVWMGEPTFMLHQIEEKLQSGYRVIKIKVGAIDFAQECAILTSIRDKFSANEVEIRVDANGAFTADDVQEKLARLATFDIHSIEQPIKPKQFELMASLCASSPIPIALDEELIGEFNYGQKRTLLKQLMPQYIILKPTLLGGFQQCREWIETAQRLNIGWWVTSALESNIGLNAVAQFTAEFNNPMPQGLGTGQLYHNNIQSPLEISNGLLHYNTNVDWEVGELFGD